MGIYDRDYYRGHSNPFLDSISRTGRVCKWLIIWNVIIFFLQAATAGRGFDYGPVTSWLDLDTRDVFQGQVWRVLTYAFLHDPNNIFHLVWNMLFLWWFGSELEAIYGPREFLTFYLVACVCGGIGFLLWPGLEQYQIGQTARALGASGAVTAVMLVFACHFPTRVILLFFFLPVPVWLLVVINVLGDFLGFLTRNTGGVAVTVHLGGALVGFLYYRYQWRLYPLFAGLKWEARRRPKAKLRVYDEVPEEPVHAAAGGTASVDEQFEAKVDAVLEKIKLYGQESLTPAEKQILLQASEKYKQRRSPT